jgi:alanine racemase
VSFPCARIDGEALRHNLAAVRGFAPGSRVMAVVKANAYGHGLTATAKALATADAFGVARLEEGLALRAASISNSVVLLEGVFTREELQLAGREQFDLVVHSFQQLELLEQYAGNHRFSVWFKIDTGMNRLGFRTDEFSEAWHRLGRCKSVGSTRLMTHLASAEDPGMSAQAQIRLFNELTVSLPLERSIANSAGLIGLPDARADWVRPGLMLYGISPVPGADAEKLGLRPAMTLTTQLIAVRRVPTGESVGYGGVWRASRDSLIGIAAIGYGDGYPRNMRVGTPMLVNEQTVCVVGRVSMDMTAVDVTDLLNVRIGDAVTAWGEGLPAERVAPYADTIAYELVCGISQRVAVQWNGGSLASQPCCKPQLE